MSFWTDVRNTVEAPFTSFGDFIGNVFGGQNIGDSLGQFGARQIAAFEGPAALIADKTKLNVVLEKASPYTLGVSGRTAHDFELAENANTSGKFSRSDFETYAKGQGENAAVAGAFVAGGPTAAIAVAGAENQYDKGGSFSNLLTTGASLAVSGSFGDTGFSDNGYVSDFLNNLQDAQSKEGDIAQNVYKRVAKNIPPTTTGTPLSTIGSVSGDNNSTVTLAISVAMGLGILYLMRKHI